MKLLRNLTPAVLMFCCTMPVIAETIGSPATAASSGDDSSEDMANLKTYVLNLGGYLGYNLASDPKSATPNGTVSSTLLNYAIANTAIKYLTYTFLGAMPVVTIGTNMSKLVPGDSPLNSVANATFKNPAYNSGQTQGVAANPLIDQGSLQGNLQNDPVTQTVMNILTTPDVSNCFGYLGKSTNPANCPLLFQYKVLGNVIGSPPPPDDANKNFFSYNYNMPLLSQLNSNVLISPLLYTTENGNSTPPNDYTPLANQGLTAQSQAQAAANFIRYASSQVTPLNLPNYKDYFDTYQVAIKPISNKSSSADIDKIMEAQNSINTYFAGLRVYAAQVSVGVSNLYYILSKRLPQEMPAAEGTQAPPPSSQALNEFKMATWRVLPATDAAGNTTDWMTQLNTASSATVQKEMAILLAEINYQMYLNRQIEERLLLTNSILLIQSSKASQPSPSFSVKEQSKGSGPVFESIGK